jgi:Transglycosylase SLT domain
MRRIRSAVLAVALLAGVTATGPVPSSPSPATTALPVRADPDPVVRAEMHQREVSRSATRHPLAIERSASRLPSKPTPTTTRRWTGTLAATRMAMTTSTGDPHAIAAAQAAGYGWGSSQLSCLTSLWNRESGWNYRATNRSSGAYGIPQSLPGSKMASAGADWRTNPATQIRWGLRYIASTYGSPCGAWAHSQSTGWY